MSRLLLDTHAVLWSLGKVRALSKLAREQIEDPDNDAIVSAASIWEIAIKRAIGKLDASSDIPREVVEAGFTWLPVSPAHAWAVRELPHHHRDPFDRLLVAQALTEGVPLVSADARLDAYGIERRW